MNRTGNEASNALSSIEALFNFDDLSNIKQIHFWDMTTYTRFLLEEKFVRILFQTASKGNSRQLSKEFGISNSYLMALSRGVYSIPLKMLLKLSHMSDISKEEIEQNIKFSRTRHGQKIAISYPIVANFTISSLVGHVFGDVYISSKKRQFEYINFDKNLLYIIENEILSYFGAVPISKKSDSNVFSSIVGDLLLLFGAPVSPKRISNTQIPDWIMHGNTEIKRSFLKAIFDDDGSVMFSEYYRAKGVNLHWTRLEKNVSDLTSLLAQVSNLLNEFNIRSSEPKFSKSEKYPDGNHITMYINITDFESIKTFRDLIGFTSNLKSKRLEKVLARIPLYTKIGEENLLGHLHKI